MDFRILGPLEVDREGGPLTLGAAKQRTLLAILLLHANEAVPTDRLIDDLWGSQPPATATNALQVYVAQLRKALEPTRARGAPSQVVLTRPGSYLLRVAPGAIDAERFEHRLDDGRRAAAAGAVTVAAELLREALDLWRGSALADFTYEPFAQAEITRLEELHISAIEHRVEAELALGRHSAMVGDLEALVREQPLRERLRCQLMLALYRTGRQAEALDVYHEARHTLTEELGIVPGPELQRLEGAILRQDPVLDPPAEVQPEPAVPIEPAPPATATRKTVTVLVAARSRTAEVDPEALREVDERYLQTARRAIQRHGGRIDSVLGDRVLAVFGVPMLHEDDALRAVRAALELSRGQVGLATGEVLTSEAESVGQSVSGEAVARAEQLAGAAATDEILLAEETFRLLGDAVRAERLGNGERLAWRLLELIPRPPPLSRPPESPIVGRASELDQLKAALGRAGRERTVHLFTILGPPGIGKTRLAEEFASHVARDATVVAGRCVPYGEGITFWPMREIVGWLTAARPLSELLAGAEAAEHIAERVTEAIGQGDATSSVEELFWAFRRLIEATAQERPLLIVLEDLHWAEPTLLDLVEYLADRVRDAPTLLLCLARPELVEERPAWGGGKRNATSLFLDRLSDAESRELIGTLAAGLPEMTRARVHETAEGNPLFLEQILAMVAEDGPVQGKVPIPPTIQAVLAARLDRLGPGERAVIERAAVVGKEFPDDVIEHQLPQDARRFTSRHLDALVHKEMLHPVRSLVPGQEAFRFRHVLIQQATYRGIPKQLRAQLHEQVAAWLERSLGGESAEYAETAGYHLEQTYRYRSELGSLADHDRELSRRAAELLASAGTRAFGRGDMPASVNLLGRSVSLLEGDEWRALELLPDLGYALFEIGELRRADEVLAQAVARARTRGDRAIEWNAVVKRGNVRMYTEPEAMDADGLIRNASDAIEALEELGDDLGLARAWSLLSEAHWITGQMTDAAIASGRGAEHARRAGSPREEAWGLGAHAMALLYGPTPAAEATRATERLLQRARGNLVLEANLAGFLAAHLAMTGRFDEARTNIQKSCERLTDLGLKWQVGVQQLLGGYIELLGGDPVASERYMRSAKDSFIEIGDKWFLSTVAADLPRPVYEQGRYEEAFALIEAIADVPAPSDAEWQTKRRGVHARLLARNGRIEEAERLAREGAAVASATDQLWFRADAVIDLAHVLRIGGRFEEAAGAAEDALRLYERKGIVPSAARTRELIKELRRSSAPSSATP